MAPNQTKQDIWDSIVDKDTDQEASAKAAQVLRQESIQRDLALETQVIRKVDGRFNSDWQKPINSVSQTSEESFVSDSLRNSS